jgi:hypothetical protein
VLAHAPEPAQEIGQAQESDKFLDTVEGKVSAKMVAVAEQKLAPDERDAVWFAHFVRWEERKHIRVTCCDRPQNFVRGSLSFYETAARDFLSRTLAAPTLALIAPQGYAF